MVCERHIRLYGGVITAETESLVPSPHALLADAQQKNAALSGLAHSYARQDESWLALHAQCAADLAAMRATLYAGGAQDTEEVDTRISQSLVFTIVDAAEPKEAAQKSRDVIASHLKEDQRIYWQNALHPIDYLARVPAASLQGIRAINAERFPNGDVDEFLRTRRAEQHDRRVEAVAAWDEGNVWGAIDGTYAADLAGFEAWLVQRSRTIKDTEYVQTELLWTLACAALERIPAMPEDYDAAVGLVRSRLAWSVGPLEVQSLAYALDN